MRALFVGLGSIGSRHLRNLSTLCAQKGLPLEVTALRASGRALGEETAALVHRQVETLKANEQFEVSFITNPTNLHAKTLAALKGRVGAFFIEKPIFEMGGYNLAALGLEEGQKAYVAAPMRWCGVYRALKEKLAGQNVFSVRVVCSSYLPGWRTGVDYRTVYSAKRAMGGGVTLDLIHEWDYVTDLFGFPLQSVNMRGKFSNLEIDSDDLSVYIARYPNFLCEVHLDYFGRRYRRTAEVFLPGGTLVADFGAGRLTLPDGTAEEHSEDANCRYMREMDYFLQYALHGAGASINSPQQALRVLQLTLGEE